MSTLLSHEDYLALAHSITLPASAFINGAFQAGDGPDMACINPATKSELTTLKMVDTDGVDYAVSKAREAFDTGIWSRCHPSERKEVMIRLCKLMNRNQHQLAVMESLDSGKPIQDCALVDLPEAISCIKWHAEAIDKIYDDTAPVGDDAMAMIIRQPIGVVGCILPWNFPLLMLAWKIGPALAAGNSVIIKPAEDTSLTALRLAELALEAGIPRGVLQVLPGDGPTTGAAIGRHPDIDMVSFTGSTETGRHFLRYSADSNLKKVTLECGGKNPAIVLHDAEHMDRVAEHIATGAFWNMGQNCSATSRVIVDERRYNELMDALIFQAEQFRQGDPLNPSNRLGVLINDTHTAKVTSYYQAACDDGLKAVTGGIDAQTNQIKPCIFAEVSPEHQIAREEVFGPLLCVIKARSTDEAVTLANQTDYGLAASIFSASLGPSLRSAKAINAGTVTVNCYGEGDITTPFGGFKQSGFGGRDNGLAAHDQFTEQKTIWVSLEDDRDKEMVNG